VSALVTPGDLRSALAVTRSLGRRGIGVTVADEGGSLAGSSPYYHGNSDEHHLVLIGDRLPGTVATGPFGGNSPGIFAQ